MFLKGKSRVTKEQEQDLESMDAKDGLTITLPLFWRKKPYIP